MEATADGRVVGGGTTNSTGAYSIPTLPPQDYVVRVKKWGYAAPDQQVHLTGDTHLDFVMDRGTVAVRGSVEESPPCVAQPVRGATVRVVDGPDAGASVTTSSIGQYSFDALRWGVVTLQASRPGYVTTEMKIDLPAPGGGSPVSAYIRLAPLSGTCGTTS